MIFVLFHSIHTKACLPPRVQLFHPLTTFPEEKQEYLKKKNDAISNGWKNQTIEQKERISQLRKTSWHNDKRRKNHIEMLKIRWNNMTEDQRIEHLVKMDIGKNKYWSNPENMEYHSNRARKKWYDQSIEDQDRILKSLTVGRQEFRNNLTLSDKIELSRKRSEGLRKYWARLSPEQFQANISKFKERLKERFDKLDIIPNKNESKFIEYIEEFYIMYEFVWYNKNKHPDFNKLFSFNPVKPGAFINPYHAWDFKLFLNDGIVLVDIDGSIHDPKCTNNKVTDKRGNKFILSDYIQFKDSQRPYQTDGLPAYVVLCYDDNLTEDTPVKNINTGEIMSFKSFISIIIWMNMSNNDKKEIINSL